MAKYVNILPDGTRQEVVYNPKHDGPVSENLYALKKVQWLAKQAKRRKGDKRLEHALRRAKERLAEANRALHLSRTALPTCQVG